MREDKSCLGFQPADYDKALKEQQEASNRYYKNQEVPYLCPLSHFKMYGVGFYLFFSFLKHATFLFLGLTVLSIAPIVFNIVRGNTFVNHQNSLNIILAKTSLGSYSYSLMTAQNSYNLSIQNKVFNASFDIAGCFIFLAFCLYWERKSKTIAQHIVKEIKLQSSSTLEVVDFPQKIRESQMHEFMGRFGSVVQTVAARDYCKQIELAKLIIQKQTEKRIMEATLLVEPENDLKIREETQKIEAKLKNLHAQIQQIKSQSHQITRFYVQFQNSQERDQVLNKFQYYQGFFGLCRSRPDSMLLKEKKVHVNPCNTQPIGVLWENAHVSWKQRIPRFILQTLIILVIMVGGFIFVSFLNILIPPVNSDANTDGLSYTDIAKSSNSVVVQAWCVKNFSIYLSSSPYYSTCSLYWTRYMASTLVSISISLAILILCQIIRRVVYALAEFQRYRTLAEKSVNIFTNLFVLELLTTTLIVFLMQANIFQLSVMTFLSRIVSNPELVSNINSIEQYSDLTANWYKEVGYQIWFNLLVMCFIPHVYMPLVSYCKECLGRYWAQKQRFHRLMQAQLELPEFAIEECYSKVMLVVATGFIFGGGIPLMMVVVLACLLFRYFYFRYHFIRFCRVPPVYNEILNSRAVDILKGILICRCLISLYMYGATDIFAMEKSTFRQWSLSLNLAVVRSVFIILSRALLTWYFSVFLLFFILLLIFKEFIVEGIKQARRKINKCLKKQTENSEINATLEQTGQNFVTIPENRKDKQAGLSSWASNQNNDIMSQRSRISSYRLENNPKYAQVLLIMRLRGDAANTAMVSHEVVNIKAIM